MIFVLILYVQTCFTVSILNRIFFTFATSVGLSRELSSLERIVSRQWLNILLNPDLHRHVYAVTPSSMPTTVAEIIDRRLETLLVYDGLVISQEPVNRLCKMWDGTSYMQCLY